MTNEQLKDLESQANRARRLAQRIEGLKADFETAGTIIITTLANDMQGKLRETKSGDITSAIREAIRKNLEFAQEEFADL